MGRDIKHVKSSDGGIVLRHPRLMISTEWVDDMRRWHQVPCGNLFLIITRGFYIQTSANLLVLQKAKGMQVTDLVSFKTGNASHPI